MDYSLEQIANRIKTAKSVLILGHTRPDGDAFGSMLALSCALEKLGIKTQACVDSAIPSNLSFVEGIEMVKESPTQPYDLLICVDCSEAQRLGFLQEEFNRAKRNRVDTINVDHHVSNTRFAKYNFVKDCAANCMNIAQLISYMGVSLDKKIAEYLLLGLLTDSGNFAHDDVREDTFLLAAKLMKAGADIRYYNYMLFGRQPKARAALHGKVMSRIRYFHEDRFAVIVIDKATMEACNADPTMTEGFVNFPLNVETVEVAASLMEMKKGQYKVSLRSKEYADVNKIAGVYGGGGHVRASGCMLFGDVEEILDKLSYTVSQYLE